MHIAARATPWPRDVTDSLLHELKSHVLDTALVKAEPDVKLENAVAPVFFRHRDGRQDAEGKPAPLRTIHDKESHEVDFVLTEENTVFEQVKVKSSDPTPSAYLQRTADQFAPARAVQIGAESHQPVQYGQAKFGTADDQTIGWRVWRVDWQG